MAPERLSVKFQTFKIWTSFEARDLEISNINCFREIFRFRDFMNTFKISRNLFGSYFLEI